MSLNYVTLTLDLYDGSGRPLTKGTVSLAPSVQLTDATDHEIITLAPVTASLGTSGPPAVKLLATDNGNPLPAGWAWTVTFSGVPGNPASFSFFLPFGGGASQNLSAISPVSSAVTQYPSWPGTALGDTVYGGASPAGVPARLAGNTSGTKNFLTQTGTGSASAAPAWGTIAAADLPAGTTGAKGALQLDGTAGDIANTGVQAAGATGKAADAGHVHFSSGMFLCAPHVYNPGTPASPGVTSATLAAFDTTNITTNSFTAPASGNVLVTASFLSAPPSTQIYAYALAAHGTVTPVVGNVITMEVSSSNVQLNAPLMFVVTGLTPGNSYQFDLLGASAAGTITIKAAGSASTAPTGSVGAPVVMMVQAI